MPNTAASFLLDDAVYKNIKEGWNAKIRSSSQKLSGLVPFVEMYAVFASNDVIFKNPMLFSQVAGRAIDIKFNYTTGSISDSAMEFQERFDIPVQAKIVPIASTAKAQIEHDTMEGSSFQGAAGINDLAVTRGASGPMNVKYSMGMTMPNPEVINEMYEYSKLMILNSKFLLVYGWNPFGFEDYIKTPPPRLVNVFGEPGAPVSLNVVELNSSNGGFYKSALVTLNRFDFSLDNVGHMGGKLTFLTLAGNFLSATRAEAVSVNIKKQLNGYSGMLFTAGAVNSGDLSTEGRDLQNETDRWIEIATDQLEESEAYAFAWEKDMDRRLAAFRHSNKIETLNYKADVGPPFLSVNKFRATQSTTIDGGDYHKTQFGPGHEKGGHPGKLIFPSSGKYGIERRENPWVANERDINDPEFETEFRRYQLFKGIEKVPGVNVPADWEGGRDHMEFKDDEWSSVRQWNRLGIGYGRPHQAGRHALFDAKVPRSIKNPQTITDARLAEWPALAEDAENSKKIWQAEPDHEDRAREGYKHYARTFNVMDTDSQGREFDTGEREVRYVPGTGLAGGGLAATDADIEGYHNWFLKWFSEQASDLYRGDGPMGTIGGMPPQYTNEKLKTIPYLEWTLKKLKNIRSTKLGFMDLDLENGIPWATPNLIPPEAFESYLQQNEVFHESSKTWGPPPAPTALDTMPAYGNDLMNDIWKSFMEPGNPNRRLFFPVNPEAAGGAVNPQDLGLRFQSSESGDADPVHFFDPETLKIMRGSCTISTMLLTEAPPQEPPAEDAVDAFIAFLSSGADAVLGDYWDTAEEQEAAELAAEEAATVEARGDRPFEPGIGENVIDELRKLATREVAIGQIENVTMISHAKPVFYFLGAVLEALRISMSNKVKFLYADIPLEESMTAGFPFPIPKINTSRMAGFQADFDKATADLISWKEGYETIDSKHADGVSFKDQNRSGWPKKDGDLSKARGDALVAAGYRYPREDELDENGMWKNLEVLIDFSGEVDFLEDKDAWGWAISMQEFVRQQGLRQEISNKAAALASQMKSNEETIMSPLSCKNVFELPVDISAVRKILNEGNAPLHSLINQVLKACNATTKTIKLATRPYAADETYLEIFVANLRIDGVSQEVFQDIDINGFLQNSSVREQVAEMGNLTAEQKQLALVKPDTNTDYAALAAARSAALGAFLSEKAVLCEFGTQRSLVESFNLSSKVDPLAFASFRLPDVVGGQMIDISKIVRGDIQSESMGLMNDIRGILEDGMYSGHQQLKNLQIIGDQGASGRTFVNTEKLRSFLLTDSPAASKIQTTFLTNLMATDQSFNTKILALQNEAITGSGDPNNPENNSFYGGVLSSYLRSISLTIHGVVGLGMFNVVYIKGLMRGIEGLYLITSVTESITPGIFSTSLECKLIQYKNTQANPLARNNNITLQAASDFAVSEEGLGITDFNALYEQTEQNMESKKNQGLLA